MYSERNDKFSIRDILIQLLFIILFIFILVWLFPTKASVNNQFADLNSKLDALTSGIYNDNLQTMKGAAVSYYTTERLPEKVNDVKRMTLKEMIDAKLLVEFTDGNGKACDLKGSYVEVVKLKNEYQMKINLSCTDNDAYIIVHLGCYDYCDATGVCEKKETPTVKPNKVNKEEVIKPTCSYEYKKVTNGVWGDYGSWSSWSTTKVTETNYRQVETKKEKVVIGKEKVQTGTKVETVDAKASTTTYCPSGYEFNSDKTKCVRNANAYYNAKCPTGYTLSGGVCYGVLNTTISTDPVCPTGYKRSGTTCFKEVSSQITVKPTCPTGYTLKGDYCLRTGDVAVVLDATCPSGYTLQGNTCYKSGTTKVTTTPTCPSGYTLNGDYCYKSGTTKVTTTPSCPSGYTLSGNYCYKKTTSGSTTTYEKGDYITTKTGTSVPANSKSYYYETVSSDYVYDCSSTCAMRWIYTYKVYKTVAKTTGGTETTLKTNAVCASGYTLSNGVCYKNVASEDKTKAICASGYTLSGGVCYKNVNNSTSVPAICATGYKLENGKCYKTSTVSDKINAICASGYTLSNGMCTKNTTSNDTKPASCPTNYVLNGTRCYKTDSNTITKTPSCPTGYTLNGDKCYGTVSVSSDPLTSTSYSCPSGYTLDGKVCKKTVPVYEERDVYETVTYYRYRERKYVSGTVDIKWSNSNNDTTLINKGYSLTGNKKCSTTK